MEAASEKEAMKILHVSAGEGHTLAITGNGCIYGWGRGLFGRLGTGNDSDELIPLKIPIKRLKQEDQLDVKIVGIAAGAYHNLALSDDGLVWSWGYNVYGQLGREDEMSSIPCAIDEVVQEGSEEIISANRKRDNGKRVLEATAVRAGGMMSLAIDRCGTLWIWGHCPLPSSENNDETFCLSFVPSPQPVQCFHGYSVSKVACGNEHVLALVNHGGTVTEEYLICYAWGSNTHGQLGLGDKKHRLVPQPLTCFNQPSTGTPFHIACGAFHTAVLTSVNQHAVPCSESAEASSYCNICQNGQGTICWTFGLGENGQLGHGTTDNKLLPEPVDGLPKYASLKLLECGLFHTCVLSESGDAWIWGMERGLGLFPNLGPPGVGGGDALYPLKLGDERSDGPLFSGPVDVGCGAAHTVVVTDNGYKLWAWGRGQNGVLGRGSILDSLVPCPVSWPPPSLLDNKQDDEKEMIDKITKSEDDSDLDEHAILNKFRVLEMSNKLSLAEEEVRFLRAKLAIVEGYSNILHYSIFGNSEPSHSIMQTIHGSNQVDIQEEWEKAMELASDTELIHMDTFYRTMRSKVKDVIMRRKINEWTRQCLNSLRLGSSNERSMPS